MTYHQAQKISGAIPEIRTIVKATFPSYTGRKFHVQQHDTPMSVTSYWDGGSRSYYTGFSFATGRTLAVPQNGTPFDGGPIAPNGVTIPPTGAIVEHCISCGRDLGITIHVAAAGRLPAANQLLALADGAPMR